MIIDNEIGFINPQEEFGNFLATGYVDEGRPLPESVLSYVSATELLGWQINYISKLFKTLDIYNFNNSVIDRLHVYANLNELSSLRAIIGNFTASKIANPVFEIGNGFRHTGSSSINTNWVPSTHAVRFQLDNYTVFGSISNLNIGFGNALFFGVTSDSASRSYFAGQLGTFGAITFSALGGQDTSVFTRINESDYAERRQSSSNYIAYQDGSSVLVSRTRAHNLPTIPHYDSGRNLDNTVSLPLPSGAYSRYSGNGSGALDYPFLRQILNDWINNIPSK